MEDKTPGPSKGYQKQVKAPPNSQPSPAHKTPADYSSPKAKQFLLFLEALESGNVDSVKNFIEDGVNVNISHSGVTPLMIAASKGLVEIAKMIIQAGANVNEQNDEGWTALHKAASDQNKSSIVALLMESGINLDLKNKSGKTALQLAEENGHRDIAHSIKKHQAAQKADVFEWEQFLATADGKPYRQNKLHERLTLYGSSCSSPLVLGAAGFGIGYAIGVRVVASFIGVALGLLVDGVYYIMEWKVRTYLADYEPLPYLNIHMLREKRASGESIALKKKKRSIFEDEAIKDRPVRHAPAISVESSPHEPSDDSAAIKAGGHQKAPAVTNNEKSRKAVYALTAAVLALLISGVVLKSGTLVKWYYAKSVERLGVPFSDQAFLNEVSKNNEEAVALFLKAGIDADTANDEGQTALMIASEKGYVNLLNKLAKLNKGSPNRIDKSGQTALMTAARNGRDQCVAALVENGADVDFLVPSGEGAASALQAAVDAADFNEEYKGVITYLLQHGADAKTRNAAGRSPLLFAAEHGRTDAARILVEKGADVNDRDLKGNFPLLSAACKGYPWFVAFLAEKGADLNMASAEGQTPLMCAVQENHGDTIKVLLDKGANVNVRNKTGVSALTDAARMGNIAVVKLLLEHGGDPANGYLPESFEHLERKGALR